MRIEALGERAIIVRQTGENSPFQIAAAARIAPIKGLIDAVASYETVGLYFEEAAPTMPELQDWLAGLNVEDVESSVHEIPVCYELGDDTFSAAEELGLAVPELISEHVSAEYLCIAIGFSPGFPYLGPVPERLRGLARMATPRPRVEPGSVGLTENQCCIYPSATPGGWRLIGRTPLELVNLKDGYFPLAAGDRIRFRPIEKAEFDRLLGSRL